MSISESTRNSKTDTPADRTLWSRRFWIGLSALLVFRLVYLAIFPLDLISDEAYYWDWSRQLDWCYYSKPPMVAWLIALSTRIGGASVFVVRLPAVLLGTGGLVFIFLLGRRLYDERVGCLAAATVAATPGAALGSLLMTIDAPFLFCWSVALFSLWRMLENRSDRKPWLLCATLATGCGLLSKQTMLGIFPLTACFLIGNPEHRREIRQPAVWVWLFGSLMFLVPVLWWNSRHEWIMFGHTSHHFAAEAVPIFKRIIRSLEFLAGQASAVSAVTFWLVTVLSVLGIKRFRHWSSRERFLYCFCGPPLLAVTLLSFKQRIEPNWPAAFYGSGIILATAWVTASIDSRIKSQPRLRTIRAQLLVGVLMVVVMYLSPFLVPRTILRGSKLDPTVRLRGWSELGREVGTELQRLPNPQQTHVIAATERGPVSELAFYLPGQPRVHQWRSSPHVSSQYGLWAFPRNLSGRDALIVTENGQPVPHGLSASFRTIVSAGETTISLGGKRRRRFSIWIGRSVDRTAAKNLTTDVQ